MSRIEPIFSKLAFCARKRENALRSAESEFKFKLLLFVAAFCARKWENALRPKLGKCVAFHLLEIYAEPTFYMASQKCETHPTSDLGLFVYSAFR